MRKLNEFIAATALITQVACARQAVAESTYQSPMVVKDFRYTAPTEVFSQAHATTGVIEINQNIVGGFMGDATRTYMVDKNCKSKVIKHSRPLPPTQPLRSDRSDYALLLNVANHPDCSEAGETTRSGCVDLIKCKADFRKAIWGTLADPIAPIFQYIQSSIESIRVRLSGGL